MTTVGDCRFITQCLACVKAGCIWLQKTFLPCRYSLDDIEIRPITTAESEEDCLNLLRDEDKESHSVDYGQFRGQVQGLDWIWAMVLCIIAALAFAIGAKYRPFKGTYVSFFRRN